MADAGGGQMRVPSGASFAGNISQCIQVLPEAQQSLLRSRRVAGHLLIPTSA